MMGKFKSIVTATVALTLICALATTALAFTNDLTAEKIEKAAAEAERAAMARVIAADSYEEGTVSGENGEYPYYTAVSGGQTAGYIFTVSNNGYGGAVKVMVGVDTDGSVAAIEVLDVSNETPGLGQRAAESTFWEQFKGKTAGFEITKSAASGNEVQALTGATTTSRSVAASVNEALKLYETVMKGVDGNG